MVALPCSLSVGRVLLSETACLRRVKTSSTCSMLILDSQGRPLRRVYLWADTPVASSHSGVYKAAEGRWGLQTHRHRSVIQKETRCSLPPLNCAPAFPTDTRGTWRVRFHFIYFQIWSLIIRLDRSWYLTAGMNQKFIRTSEETPLINQTSTDTQLYN